MFELCPHSTRKKSIPTKTIFAVRFNILNFFRITDVSFVLFFKLTYTPYNLSHMNTEVEILRFTQKKNDLNWWSSFQLIAILRKKILTTLVGLRLLHDLN